MRELRLVGPGLRAVVYAVLVLWAVATLLPFLWSLSTAFTRTEDVHRLLDHYLIPPRPTLENFAYVMGYRYFPRWVWNSVVVATLITGGQLVLNSLCGYALARIPFPGRELLFWYVLATMMIPGVVLLVPQYMILKHLGWLDTYQGLVVPFVSNAFGIFLMRQFFLGIPRELEEAARIDGLGRLGMFLHVALPLARSALAAQFIFMFLGNWNSFMWPFLIARSAEMFTLPVGLQAFKQQHYQFWNQVMAGGMFLTVPVLLVYAFLQRWIVRGVTMSGLKG